MGLQMAHYLEINKHGQELRKGHIFTQILTVGS